MKDFLIVVGIIAAVLAVLQYVLHVNLKEKLAALEQRFDLHRAMTSPLPVVAPPPAAVTVHAADGATVHVTTQVVGADAQGNAIPAPTSLLGRIANGIKEAFAEGMLSADPALAAIAANYAARLFVQDGGDHAPTIAFYRTLPAASLAMVRSAYLDPKGLYAPDQAGYDANRPAQQAMYEAAWANIAAQLS